MQNNLWLFGTFTTAATEIHFIYGTINIAYDGDIESTVFPHNFISFFSSRIVKHEHIPGIMKIHGNGDGDDDVDGVRNNKNKKKKLFKLPT